MTFLMMLMVWLDQPQQQLSSQNLLVECVGITFPMMLILLIGAHAFADYPGQGDFLSKAKNRTAPIPGVPWWQALGAHVAIHGALVALITGIWWLALAEAAIHFATDDAKCRGRISFNTDQAIHLLCKLAWALLAWSLA